MLPASAFIFLFLLLCQKGLSVPRAIIHIGPHKAASTYIQSELVRFAKEMANENLFWPTRKDGVLMGIKDIAGFANSLRKHQNVPDSEVSTMKEFIQQSLQNNRSIIMSSEEFDITNSVPCTALKNHLQGFNVTIVFVYRELLAQLISLHFELNRFEHESTVMFSSSFSSFLVRSLQNIPAMARPFDILNAYANVFGADKIRIIDLLGVAAAQENIAHVLLCEIGGVLCGHSGIPHPHHLNSAYSLIPAQMFSFFKSYMERQSNGTCKFSGSVFQEYRLFSDRYLSQTKDHPPPTVITAVLSLLVPYAQQVDANLRATYGSAILHSNPEANLKSMSKAQIQEIDPELFMQDVYWNDWIQSEFEVALAANKLLCN